MEIEQVYQPRGGTMMTEKIIEAYVAASKDAADVTGDTTTALLFESYRKQSIDDVDGIPHKVFANVKEEPVQKGTQKRVYRGKRDEWDTRTLHTVDTEVRCACCQTIDFVCPTEPMESVGGEQVSGFSGKK